MNTINVSPSDFHKEPLRREYFILKLSLIACGSLFLIGLLIFVVSISYQSLAKNQQPRKIEDTKRGDTRRTETPDNIKVVEVPQEKIVIVTPTPEQLECYQNFKGGNACFKDEYQPNNLVVGDGSYSEAYYPNKQQNPCLRVVNGFLINSCW